MVNSTLLPPSHRRSSLLTWLLALLLAGPAALAQIPGGTYTINSAQPSTYFSGGTNFTNFADASQELNLNGVTGAVTFTVVGGPYDEQVYLGPAAIPGASATNRVVFNGGGAAIRYNSTTSARRAVVTLQGTSYVTLNNLVLDATVGGTAAGGYGWGVQLTGNANNNTINGCTILTRTSGTANVYAGIVSGTSATNTNGAGATTNQNLTLTNNTITGGDVGIAVVGNSASALTPGIVISNNSIRDSYNYGVFTRFLTGVQILGNDVSRPTLGAGTGLTDDYVGIRVGDNVSAATVDKNRIHNPFGSVPGATNLATGIELDGGSTPTTAGPNVVTNNLIYDMNGNGTQYGINNGSSANSRYYHNTVVLADQINTSANLSYGYAQTTPGALLEFKNNIVQVTRAGAGAKYALYLTSTSTANGPNSNNNDLYVGGTAAVTSRYGTTDYLTLAAWKTASTNRFDQNSVAVDPGYVSLAAGNLQPTAPALNGAAAPLAAVPTVATDIAGAARSTTAPDIGAYEFAPAPNDVAVVALTSPAAPITTGPRVVSVSLLNNGAAPLTSVQLQYVLNGGAAVVQTLTLNPAVASGATQTVSFATQATLTTGPNTLVVTASLPNGQPDPTPGNNVLTTTLYPALLGSYTINKSQPASLTNFVSFAAAAANLNGGGILGSVRFNVLNGPYNEQFALNPVVGATATDTIVVDGGAARQTLAYSSTAAQPAAVLLNGADFVTIQNLTIDVSNSTYGIGVHLLNQAENNRVKNCQIYAPLFTTNLDTNAGIAASGSPSTLTVASSPNNLRIENNTISGGVYGISTVGTGTRTAGVRITGNEVSDFYQRGIYLEFAASPRVLDNNVHRTNRLLSDDFYGLYLRNLNGAAVERNRIHDSFTGNPANTSEAYGIYYAAGGGTATGYNDFVNNEVYNLNGAGTEYGLYNNASGFCRYYHNTVLLDNQAYVGTRLSYGFYQTGTAASVLLQNNLLVVTRTGAAAASRYALYFNTLASTITSNYNDLFIGTGSAYFTGRYNALDFATLANWRTANAGAYDQNSVALDPVFSVTATTTGALRPSSTALDNKGTPVARATTDIIGTVRSTTTPDIGAYEYAPVTNDVTLVSIDAPASPAAAGPLAVTVTIRNSASLPLNAVTLTYALNGGAAVTQTFALTPALTTFTNQQLTFSATLLALSGPNTLTVTATLPNGAADQNPSDNVVTITFTQATPNNDEPCAAVTLPLGGAATIGSNFGATNSAQPGISTPACSPAVLPRDVWFAFTPTTASMALALSGAPAGMVRVFSSPNCSAGPFALVLCQSSGASNTALGAPVTVAGLTPGTRYYVAVSGYGSSDAGGQFTIQATSILASRPLADIEALVVYPNPSSTGQLTLRLGGPARAGQATLYNALGQVVRQQALPAAPEHTLATDHLAAGLYTLRVRQGEEVLTRKVVLE